jgi:hypothetical protein
MSNNSAQSCERKRMNASKLILLAGFAIITAEFSFAQNTPTPTATIVPDPVKSFEKLVTTFPKRSIFKSSKTTAYDIENVTFDVKKTDSLMNPVIGIINFTAKIPYPTGSEAQKHGVTPTHFAYIQMQMEFHWQGDHWTFERLLYRENSHDITHTGMGEDILGAGPMSDFLKSVQ